MKTNLMKRSAGMFAALSFILLGSLTAAPANAAPALALAPATSQTIEAPNGEVENLAVWVPYDNSVITSSANCTRRLSYLRANVNWVTTANSRCQRFTAPACGGSSYYWLVMVLSDGGSRAATLPRAATLALAC